MTKAQAKIKWCQVLKRGNLNKKVADLYTHWMIGNPIQ